MSSLTGVGRGSIYQVSRVLDSTTYVKLCGCWEGVLFLSLPSFYSLDPGPSTCLSGCQQKTSTHQEWNLAGAGGKGAELLRIELVLPVMSVGESQPVP